jgi:hypothetical protein
MATSRTAVQSYVTGYESWRMCCGIRERMRCGRRHAMLHIHAACMYCSISCMRFPSQAVAAVAAATCVAGGAAA